MNTFWGYAGADLLAILVIGVASAACLASARLFVRNYGK